MTYDGLFTERQEWRKQMNAAIWVEPLIMQAYRLNRDSELWRATRQVEQLCEYILFLEDLLLEEGTHDRTNNGKNKR